MITKEITLRDYFAANASSEDIENHRAYIVVPETGRRNYVDSIEDAKYNYADAMLEARK